MSHISLFEFSAKRPILMPDNADSTTSLMERALNDEQSKDLDGTETLDTLFHSIYAELKSRARSLRRRYPLNDTLNTRALIHEAYLKLRGGKAENWQTDSHFLSAAAKAMKHILIDYARKKQSQKRGGADTLLSLSGQGETCNAPGRIIAGHNNSDFQDLNHAEQLLPIREQGAAPSLDHQTLADVLTLDKALQQFKTQHPREAEIFELRLFAGLSVEEVSSHLSISPATVKRDWSYAQAWIYREIHRGND